MLRVQFLHAFARDMCVDLRSGQVAVAEQHLHDTQIGAVIEKMCRKRVTQRVRGQRLLHIRFLRIPFDNVPKRLASHAIAAARRK